MPYTVNPDHGYLEWRDRPGGSGIDIQIINVDGATVPGTNPVVATAGGVISITGGQVDASTTDNAIRIHSYAANAFTVDIQRSTTSASSDVTINGISHFNSGHFSVDANGFVSATGGGLGWVNIGASQTLAVNTGYFCSSGGALSLALPTTSSVGDVIAVVLDGSTSWTVTQGAGQQMRIGNVETTSGAGGSIASTSVGDTIYFVCRTANTRWVVINSTGVFTVV